MNLWTLNFTSLRHNYCFFFLQLENIFQKQSDQARNAWLEVTLPYHQSYTFITGQLIDKLICSTYNWRKLSCMILEKNWRCNILVLCGIHCDMEDFPQGNLLYLKELVNLEWWMWFCSGMHIVRQPMQGLVYLISWSRMINEFSLYMQSSQATNPHESKNPQIRLNYVLSDRILMKISHVNWEPMQVLLLCIKQQKGGSMTC